jgi:hypothetical protein
MWTIIMNGNLHHPSEWILYAKIQPIIEGNEWNILYIVIWIGQIQSGGGFSQGSLTPAIIIERSLKPRTS